ncbi:MCE family protein [bacterium]|nr:MCE family protein [bacterium]
MISKKIKTKNAVKWLIELSIWFLVFIFFANIILFIKSNHDKQYNSYQIFMPDVDGVIVGSPVNMMGVQIGYVNKVKIIDNEVFVRFTLNKKDLKLPKGCVITVEFSGLGGSKSLEVYPPDEESKNRDEYLIVEAPKRLGDVVGLVDEMFDKISSITYRMSFFFKETSNAYSNLDDLSDDTNLEQKNSKEKNKKSKPNKDFSKILKETNLWLDENTKKLENFNNK